MSVNPPAVVRPVEAEHSSACPPVRRRRQRRAGGGAHGDCIVRLAELMEDTGFRQFFEEYFAEWSDIKAVVMLMKAYQFLDQEYRRLSGGQQLSRERLCYFLRRVLVTSELRTHLTDTMEHFMASDVDFGQTCHRLLAAEFAQQAGLGGGGGGGGSGNIRIQMAARSSDGTDPSS